jgi:ABC-type sugar transport system substrate-binding protein
MERRTLLKIGAAGLIATAALPMPRVFAQKKYRFGFSQATILETWRVQFNKDMKKEAEKHPELELIIADGQNKTEKQVADVENFITQGVDVLIISPKESAGLTPATLKAIEAGIPVIILDRNVNTDKYTQFIGGDNVVIGKAAGTYAVKLLAARARPRATSSSSGAASPAHRRTTAAPAITRSPTRSPASSRCCRRSTPNGSRPRATRSWRPPSRPTSRSTSSMPTTTRWPTTPTWRPRMPAARRA